jgi:hypothetical protein
LTFLVACSSAAHPSTGAPVEGPDARPTDETSPGDDTPDVGAPDVAASDVAAVDVDAGDGAPADPWAGDPFADAAPPDEPPDASYPDPSGDGGVTWADWVSGFSNVYCVACHNPQAPCGGSGCHVASNPQVFGLLFDLREKSAWTARAATIECGVVVTQPSGWTCEVPPETYPKVAEGHPLPSPDERASVADWIEAGCP